MKQDKRHLKINFKNGMDTNRAHEALMNIFGFTVMIYEQEGFDTPEAMLEANKLVFSNPQPLLNGCCIAQWLSRGGDEQRAMEAVRDTILAAKKTQIDEIEARVVIARVFGGHR